MVASRKPPFVPTNSGATSVFPSGRRTETRTEQQVEVHTVTSAIWTLTRSPAVPAKLTRAFWPGAVDATANGGPPAAMAPVSSGGTSWSVSVAAPTLVHWGSTRTE